MKATWAALALAAQAAGATAADGTAADGTASYRAEIETWRGDRETRLKAPGGWLALAGLFWLKPGENRLGTAPGSDILLPAGSAPERAGVIELRDRQVSLRLEPGVAAEIKGRPITSADLRSDAGGEPDVVSLGRLTMQVIERSGRLGIRVRDPESPVRRGFKGLQWFPVDQGWRVTARFVPHEAPRTVELADVTGAVQKMTAPGYVVFTHQGRELMLEPVLEGAGAKELFFIFRDETSGHETYGAGRYLYAALPREGAVVIDFNKAYSPPCAFTRFATCPLPPRQNRLGVRVEAGEKHAGEHP
jgi:uncharacterized protein (DUF1684 family)